MNIKLLKKERERAVILVLKERLSAAKNRAKSKGLPFELTLEIILQKLKEQNWRCAISHGIKLSFIHNTPYVISIDRIDSSLGYTVENTMLVVHYNNIAKAEMSLTQYKLISKESSQDF